MSKAKEKEENDIEVCTHLINSLTVEVDELKQHMIETMMSSRPSKYLQKKNVASSNSNS